MDLAGVMPSRQQRRCRGPCRKAISLVSSCWVTVTLAVENKWRIGVSLEVWKRDEHMLCK